MPRNSPGATVEGRRCRPPGRRPASSDVVDPTGRETSSNGLRRVHGATPPRVDRPQRRVADLVEGVVEQREGGAEQRRCRRPARCAHSGLAGLQRRRCSAPSRASCPSSACSGRRGRGTAGRRRSAPRRARRRGSSPRSARSSSADLDDDDVEPPLAAHPRRLEEVPVAQRQRLGAQLARAVGPAGDDQHDDDQRPGVPLCRRSAARMMISGKVGMTRNTLVSSDRTSSHEAAEVGGGDADQHREHGGEAARRRAR